jgi:hypothetical protein
MSKSWILDNFVLIGFVSFFVLAILEMLIRKLFPLVYFRYGIPIIGYNTPFFSSAKPLPLEEFQFEAVESRPYIEIQRLNECEYGLWPAKFKFRPRTRLSNYGPLTRGYINFDKPNNRLRFLVYFNWYALLFLLMWFGIAIIMPPWLIKIILVAGGAFVVFTLYRREQERYFEIWHQVRGE